MVRNRKSKSKRRGSRQQSTVVVAKPRVPRNRMSVSSAMVEQTCAVTDPFCPVARGAKWMLGSATNTLTYQSRVVTNITTNANGYGYLVFFPNPVATTGYTYRSATTVNPWAPGSMNQGDSVFGTTYATGAIGALRVVSSGVRWWDIAASTAVGGGVTVIPVVNQRAFNNIAAFDYGSLSLSPEAEQIDRRKPGLWISKKTGTNPYKFFDKSTDYETDMDAQVSSGVILVVSGAVSSVVLQVEMVVNYEWVLDNDTVFSKTQSVARASPSQAAAQHASTMLEETISSVWQGTAESFGAYVRKNAGNVLKRLGYAAGTAIGGYFGGPAGAYAGSQVSGYIMDVD